MNCRALAASVIFLPLTALAAIKSEPIPELRPPRKELPAPAQQESRPMWPLIAVGAALLLLAACWPRRKPAPPPPEPFTVAQRELAALRTDTAQATTAEISSILRRYVVGAFALNGSAPTSEEVISGLTLRRSCPAELVNEASVDELARFFWELGDERQARRFARAIEKERQHRRFETTLQLANLIERLSPRHGKKTHPARLFQ